MTLDTFIQEYQNENKPRFDLKRALAVPAMVATIATGIVGMALSKPAYADVLVVPGTGVVYVQGQGDTAQQLTVGGDTKSRIMPIAPGRTVPVDLDKFVGTSSAVRFSVENGKDPLVTGGAVFYTDKVGTNNGQALITGSNGETTTLYVVGDAGKAVSLDCYNPAGDKVGTQSVTIPGNGVYTSDISSLFTALPNATVKTGTAGVGLAAKIGGTSTRTVMGLATAGSIPTDPETIAKGYVAKWLPKNDAGFYLSNTEIRAMINGGAGTQSYLHDLAVILFDHTTPPLPGDEAQLEQGLKEEADGNLTNGELYHGFDPSQWNRGQPLGPPVFKLYVEPSGNYISFVMDDTGIIEMYYLIKDEFLWRFVMNSPSLYGGSVGGLPRADFNPTWNTQDPN